MGVYLNPNNVLFQRDLKSEIYVDKSMVIEKLNNIIDTSNNYLCVSRPRRFGKTMATNLISAFYSKGCDSRELFSNLKIAQLPGWDKNLNKLNVIKFDVQGFLAFIDEPENLPKKINTSINKELVKSFPEADIDIDDFLGESIVKVYATTGEQFILIMDEYDVMVRQEVSKKAFDNYLKFLNGLFKNSNVRPALHLAYLTGILPIVRDKIQSKLNEFKEYSVIMPRELSGFIGFTEPEVEELCKQYKMDFPECKKWYNGYKIGTEEAIYNPCSVVEAMNNKEYSDYWTITGSYEALKNYIMLNFEGIRNDIISMIGGSTVKVEVLSFLNTMTSFHSKDDVFTYLIHLGYLAYDSREKVCWIPNNEIRSEWIISIRNEPQYKTVIDMVNESRTLLEQTIALNETAVAQALDKAHIIATNPKTYNNEGALQSAICLAYFYAYNYYTVIQELPTGEGYADVVFLPVHPGQGKPALVVELKMNKTTATALTQIKAKQYGQDLSHYIGDMLFIGINYDPETKEHQCKIEKLMM